MFAKELAVIVRALRGLEKYVERNAAGKARKKKQ
jgi:hypothetical protein